MYEHVRRTESEGKRDARMRRTEGFGHEKSWQMREQEGMRDARMRRIERCKI